MFKEIKAANIKGNLIEKISNEWMLISAGNENGYNMMTASWGFMGEMWGKDTAIAMIRPQRYTMEFIEKSDYYTLSFYGEQRDIHKVCGSKSGRDVNKTELAGLTPIFSDNTVYFEEADLVIICKKQYVDTIKEENFIDSSPLKWYGNKDFHNMVFGEIIKVLIKE